MGRGTHIFCAAAIVGSIVPALANAAISSSPVWLTDPQKNCQVLYPDSRPADSVAWSGSCANGRATGFGTATFADAGNFVSQVSGNFAAGAAAGQVRASWADGGRFVGLEKSGRFDGQGTFTAGNGDQFAGQWVDGKLNGYGVVVRASGERYDGEWKDNLPNGHGVLVRKDGSKFDGQFLNGEPKPAPVAVASNAPTAPTAQQASAPAAGPLSNDAKLADGPQTADSADGAEPHWLDSISGQKLTALDGSSFTLSIGEEGFTREIVSAAGAAQGTTFAFLNAKQGTVVDPKRPNQVLGVFRLDEAGLAIDYADGRSESLKPNSAGGISMAVRAAGSQDCAAWYPQGHTFTAAEREVALAEYATRLGLPAPGIKRAASKQGCDFESTTSPSPLPTTVTAKVQAPGAHEPATEPPAKVQGDKAAALATGSTTPIVVKASRVHLIDGDANAITSDSSADRGGRCLSMETQGARWGFHNACGFPVQVAWCVMGGTNERISCDGGAVGAAVAANSFGALFAETGLTAEHDVRWIACEGGAGDVVPRLVRADPPMGRCVRGRAS